MQAALTDLSGNIFVFNKAAIDKKSDADRVLKMVEKEIKAHAKTDLVIAVEISLRGTYRTVWVVNSSILQWKNVDVKGRIEKLCVTLIYHQQLINKAMCVQNMCGDNKTTLCS